MHIHQKVIPIAGQAGEGSTLYSMGPAKTSELGAAFANELGAQGPLGALVSYY